MLWTLTFGFLLFDLIIAEYGWKGGHQYEYKLEGRTLTALNQIADQYIGVLFRGNLRIQTKSDDLLSCQLTQAEYADIHANLSGGWASFVPDKWLHYKQLPMQNKPFELKLKEGVITGITVDQNLPVWEVNFIKSVASQLQLDTQGANQKNSKYNQIPQGDNYLGLYTTMEDSINGIYETVYTVSPLPEYVYQSRPELASLPNLQGEDGQLIEIVKSRNFSNAKQHVVHRFGWNGWKAGTNKMGDFVTRSSESRIIISGTPKQYTIQSSVTVEKVVLAPHLYNKEKGIVVSRMNLTLKSVNPAQDQVPSVDSSITLPNLVYEGLKEGGFSHSHGRMLKPQSGKSSDSSSSSSESRSSSNEENSSKTMSKHSSLQSNYETINKFSTENNYPPGGGEVKMEKFSMSDIWKKWKKFIFNEDSSSSESSSSSEDSSSLDSTSSSEEYLDPNPTIQQVPINPFFPNYDNFGENAQFPSYAEAVVRLARNISLGFEEPNLISGQNILSMFTILKRVIGSMSVQGIEEATEKLYNKEFLSQHRRRNSTNYYSWVIFRDAVAEAGTGPALVNMRNWLTSSKVRGEEAAQMIAALPRSSRYPNTEYMNYFFELIKEDVVQNQKYLNTSAVLSFSELIRKSQVDYETSHNQYPIHLHKTRVHSHVVEEQYVPYFAKQLQTAVHEENSEAIQTYIIALGKTAHPTVLSVYKPYLEGQKPLTKYQRLLIVVSLSEMTRLHPNEVRHVLFNIYKNMNENSEIRATAAVQVMKTNPPAQMLQRMAQQTHYDQSNQVNAAVKSAIQSAANSQNLEHSQLAANARAAMNLLNLENYGFQYSKNIIKSVLAKNLNIAYKHNFAYIQGNDSILPNFMFYDVQRNLRGYENELYACSYGISSSGRLLNQIFDQINGLKQARNLSQREEAPSNEYNFPDISKFYSGQYESTEPLESNLFLNIFGGKRLYTFNENSFQQLTKMVSELYPVISLVKQFNFVKLYDEQSLELGFPLATGFPFIYSHQMPTLISIDGKLSGQGSQESNEDFFNFDTHLMGDFQIIYAGRKQGSMGFITPFNQQHYISAAERNLFVNIPIHSKMKMQSRNRREKMELNFEVEPLNPKKKTKIFEISSRIYTSKVLSSQAVSHFWSENTRTVHRKQPMLYHNNLGDKKTGFSFDIDIMSERNKMDLVMDLKDAFENHNLLPLLENQKWSNEIHNNNITVTYNSEKSSAQRAKFCFALYSHESREKISNNERIHNYTETYKYNNRSSDQIPTISEKKQKREKFFENVESDIPSASSQMFDASVTFEGDSNIQYLLTAASANSEISDNNRVLLVFSRNSGPSTNQMSLLIKLQVNSVFPRVPIGNYKQALNSDGTSHIKAQLDIEKEFSKSQITIQGELQRTPDRMKFLSHHQVSRDCENEMNGGNYLLPTCRNVTVNANYLNYYKFKIQHKRVPKEFSSMIYKVYDIMREFGYTYKNEILTDSKQNDIDVEVQISPNLNLLNVTLKAPQYRTEFTNIPLDQMAIPLVVLHPRLSPIQRFYYKLLSSFEKPTCALDASRANTFNNRTYPIALGQCWHIMAISSQKQYPRFYKNFQYASFEIYVRDMDSNRREMKIKLAEDYIEISPSKIRINGENLKVSSIEVTRQKTNNTEIVAYKLETDTLVIQFPIQGIYLFYDGSRIQLSLDNNYRGRIRGLCGTYNGESLSDYMSSQNCFLNNPYEFAASYAINDNSCKGKAMKFQESLKNKPCFKKEDTYETVVLTPEKERMTEKYKQLNKYNSKSRNYEKNDCSYNKMKIIENLGKKCFSMTPITACDPECVPSSFVEKTIDFYCVSDPIEARHWTTLVEQGAIPDFMRKTKGLQTTIRLPETCVPSKPKFRSK